MYVRILFYFGLTFGDFNTFQALAVFVSCQTARATQSYKKRGVWWNGLKQFFFITLLNRASVEISNRIYHKRHPSFVYVRRDILKSHFNYIVKPAEKLTIINFLYICATRSRHVCVCSYARYIAIKISSLRAGWKTLWKSPCSMKRNECQCHECAQEFHFT